MSRTLYLMLTTATLAVLKSEGELTASVPEPPAEVQRNDTLKSSDRIAEKKPRPELSEAELTATMEFASEHHPELARLLEHLRKSRPHEFQCAARELNQQIQSLEKQRERNSARYLHHLELWKRDSEIRVLAAKWSLAGDESLEQEIRQLLRQRREAKLVQLKADQQRLSEQLQRVEKQIASLSDEPDLQIDREWEQLAKKTSANKKVNTRKNSN